MQWQEHVETAVSFVATLEGGIQVRLLKSKGSCKEGCTKWQVYCPPFILRPETLEVTEDDVETAQFAAAQLVKARITNVLNTFGEMK